MFYSVYVLGKKGPLARVWLAAHWDKKITKAQILETNIVESVDSILKPRVKLSLRTSSHLLLGVVRIYARKTLYLLQDCQDAAFKIKSAFRPGVVDLPDGKTEAAIAAITLPETFDFDLIAEPPMQIEPVQTNANIKNITLSDDVISINVDDDLYMGQNIQNNWSDMSTINSSQSKIIDNTLQPASKEPSLWEMYDRPADDGFGDFGGNIEDVDDLFSLPIPSEMTAGDGQQNAGAHHQPEYQKNPIETEPAENGKTHENGQPMSNGANTDDIDLPFDLDRPSSRMSDRSDSMSYGAPPSIAPSAPSTPGSIGGDIDVDMPGGRALGSVGGMDDPLMADSHEIERNQDSSLFSSKQAGEANNLESMVLEPIEEGAGFERRKKRRKKLGIIIDEVKTLSGEEMKSQLSDTTDIIADLDLAPPSKKLMYLKRTAGIEKLFANPIVPIPSKISLNYYTRNLITSKLDRVEEERELATAGDYLNGTHDVSKHFELSQLDDLGPPDEFRRPDDFSIPDQEDNCPEPMLPPISPLREIQAPKTPRTPRRETIDKTSKKKRKSDTTLDRADKPPKTPRLDASERFANSQFSINNFNENSEIERARRDESSNISHLPQADSLMVHPEDDFEDNYEYEQPMSVGPPEEMMPDETADQFEERMRNKRTNVLLRLMANQLDEYGLIEFTHLVKNNRRKQVAQKFYSLLVLKKQQAIELAQDNKLAYGELVVEKGERYDQALAAFSL